MKIIYTIVGLLGFTLAGSAQTDQQLISLGNKLYKQRQFEKAAQEYQKAAELNNKNVKAQFNMGNALYRSKKVEAAQKVFDAAAENSDDKPLKTNAYYNKGVTLSQQKKLEESIEAYKQSLRLSPEDNEARENLQKALNELKKKQDQQPSPKDDKKKNDQDKKDQKDEPQKSKSKLNEKQAEQMLNALRQEEKNIQKDLQKSKKQNSNTPGKDW